MGKNQSQLRPQLSFYNATRLLLTLESGETVSVRECGEAEFASIIRQAVQHSEKREVLEKELKDLAYGHMSDRWWALNALRRHNITVGIAPTITGGKTIDMYSR